MAPSDAYTSAGSTGKLKLKGVKDSKIDKKKKKEIFLVKAARQRGWRRCGGG